MSKKTNAIKITAFDAADYLKNDAMIAEYLTAALEENDPDILILAIADVAKARGMTEIARKSGLGRESIYKAIKPGSKPRFDTIRRVCEALGVRLVAQVVHA